MTLSNIELENIANELGFRLITVMSDDLLKIPMHPNMNIIINLDDPENGGTHWVSFMVINAKHGLYFDSFGCQPDDYIIKYCKKYNLSLYCNTYIIQDIKSTECGHFCLAFINYILFENPNKYTNRLYPNNDLLELYNDFVNMFEPNAKINDKIVLEYIYN